ncbi:hypothetical protein FIBSPDRAFT_1050831 [Athelia psychrophila]|uniref:Nephrocystin 3-like N-terminal domain-containing protein n=1 Tax=Athelia psychrophila TaxID=1759441 RepID=A0A166A9W1_9AGAM|nr:hypothetical protein FIBSPDRAFT_1050831 [Fibularhizoctonia sp. CBS 109695]
MSLQLSRPTHGSLNCGAEIVISDLLLRCRYGQDADLDLRGNKSGLQGRIKIRLSLSRSGSWSDDEAQRLALVLTQQPNTAMSATGGCIDAVDGLLAISFPTPPAMAAQSIQNVLGKLENIMRIAGAVSEIHPYAKGAWDVLSAAYKIIVAQVAIDQSVADLFQTMQDVYGFVDAMDAVTSRTEHVEKIIKQILIQTGECGRLIQEYSGHGFGGRLLRENMGASTPAKVAAMAKSLTTLHGQFDTGVTVHIAVVCFHIQTDVTALLEDTTLDRLGSSGVDLGSLSCCLTGTRCDAIDEILEWASKPSQGDNSNILCLYGVAGIGKSAVAATVATHFSKMGRLGGFVGFDRAFPEQSQVSTAVKALARQLAEHDGRLRAGITETIKDCTKGSVLRASLAEQFDRLIVQTLKSIPALAGEGPIVIVLDGWYECGQPDDWASLLELLIDKTDSLPSNLRFIITSRTVNGIHDAVSSNILHPRIKSLELRSSSQSDISAYFAFRMQQIQRKHQDLKEDWPGRAAIMELTARAFGFFPWAVNAGNFVNAHCPPKRLKSLLLQPLRSISAPNTALDELYRAALNSAGDWTDADFVSDFRAIMGAIIESPIAISTTAITRLVDLPLLRPFMVTIRCLGSLMTHGPVVRILHPSFLYFLSSRERCGCDAWYFGDGPVRVSAEPATVCLQRMNAGLKRNICNMSLSARLAAEVLPEELAYACQSWVENICTSARFESWEMDTLVVFLRTHLLHWFEAMSLLKKSEEIAPMLRRVAAWLEENTFEDKSLKDLVIEAIDLARKFTADIAEHPLYVYYTALPLLPSHSVLYRLFYNELVDPSVLLVINPDFVRCLALSTNGRQIVAGSYDHAIVRDTATGEELVKMADTDGGAYPFSVAFSYDGSRITCGTDISTVYVWDSVTGTRVIGPLSHSGSSRVVNVVAWSTDGNFLLSGCQTGEVILWNITSPNDNQPVTKIHHLGCNRWENPLSSLVFSLDGSQIASCSRRGDVHVWDSKTGGIVWSVQDPQGSDPSGGISFLSSDMREFLVVKTKERTQVRDASTGDLCPLPDSLAGAVGLTRDDLRVNLLIEGIVKHHGRPLCEILLKGSFNNIVLLPLYAVLLYILLRAIFEPFFFPLSGILGPWYAAVSDFWLVRHIHAYTSARPSRIPVARVGPNKVVFKDASSGKNAYSLHQFGKTAAYKAIQTLVPLEHAPHAMRKMIYTPHHASNHLAFLQTEIYDFTHGLVKHCWQDTGRQFDCLLLFRRSFTDVIVISNRGHRLGVFKKWLPGAEELLTTAIGDCPKQGILVEERGSDMGMGPRLSSPQCTRPSDKVYFLLFTSIPSSNWLSISQIMAELVSVRVCETHTQMKAGKIGDSEKPFRA